MANIDPSAAMMPAVNGLLRNSDTSSSGVVRTQAADDEQRHERQACAHGGQPQCVERHDRRKMLDAPHERNHAHKGDKRGRHVPRAGVLHADFGQYDDADDDAERHERDVHHERCMPAEVLQQKAADQRACRHAEAGNGRPSGKRERAFFRIGKDGS